VPHADTLLLDGRIAVDDGLFLYIGNGWGGFNRQLLKVSASWTVV
jgi:hypothetical protein